MTIWLTINSRWKDKNQCTLVVSLNKTSFTLLTIYNDICMGKQSHICAWRKRRFRRFQVIFQNLQIIKYCWKYQLSWMIFLINNDSRYVQILFQNILAVYCACILQWNPRCRHDLMSRISRNGELLKNVFGFFFGFLLYYHTYVVEFEHEHFQMGK